MALPPPGPPEARGRARRPRRFGFTPGELRRALLALGAVVLCEVVGTVGFQLLENMGWVNAFYEESMLATGQGPAIALVHASSKVFASVMGFFSLGSVLTTVVFVLGPALAKIWHEARIEAEQEARRLEAEFAHGLHEVREELRRGPPPEGPP